MPTRWWTLKGQECANSITGVVESLQAKQEGRIRQYVINARLYGNNSIYGMGGARVAQLPASKERMSDPVTMSVIDTATARIGQNKPRPYFLTSGGSYKLQRKAKQLNKLLDGVFYEAKAYRIGAEAQRDCEVFGDGLLHVFPRHKRVAIERVLPHEIWVDEVEAVYGRPRQLHWVRPADRELLIGLFPKHEVAIRSAPSAQFKDLGIDQVQADMVMVRQSWHLRSSPDADDGLEVISIAGTVLQEREWTRDFFPFARFRWSPRPMGYWSQGLCEQLTPKQLELNKLLFIIQRSFHMAGSFKIFLEEGSKIVKAHVNNDIATIITYRGKPPEYFVPQVIPPEYYQQVLWIVQSMYERAGFPPLVSSGQKPAGLNSGQAIRDYKDTTSERQKTAEELNQDAYMDLGTMAVAVAQEIAEEEGGYYEASAPTGRTMETVKLSAEDLASDEYHQQCFPTSSLPKEPGARLQTITEYIQAGFVNQRQGRRLLDFPDLEAHESLANAAEDLLTKVLDDICDEGEFAPPEPTDDLLMAKELVVEFINRARSQGLEEDRLDLLRTWNVQVDALMQATAPPPAPPGVPGAPMPMDPMAMPPGMGPPQALPAGPPTSPLVPMQMPG